jgi:hypothetical protein
MFFLQLPSSSSNASAIIPNSLFLKLLNIISTKQPRQDRREY